MLSAHQMRQIVVTYFLQLACLLSCLQAAGCCASAHYVCYNLKPHLFEENHTSPLGLYKVFAYIKGHLYQVETNCV